MLHSQHGAAEIINVQDAGKSAAAQEIARLKARSAFAATCDHHGHERFGQGERAESV
jgi:hypothetical protein